MSSTKEPPLPPSRKPSILHAFFHVLDPCPWFRRWAVCAIVANVWLLIAAAGFHNLESEWTFFESYYFANTIASTIGYGCLSPSSRGSRWWALILILTSIPLITYALAETWRPLTQIPYDILARAIRRWAPHASEMPDNPMQPLKPPNAWQFYTRRLLPVILYFYLVGLPMMSLFCWAAGEDLGAFKDSLREADGRLSFFESVYFAVVSSSTVGFGDICPQTDDGRLFTIFAAGYGWGTVTLFVSKAIGAVQERQEMLDGFRNLRVAASSGAALLETLDSIGGASVSGGIGRAEFALGMLATLKHVNMAEDVQPLLDCFDAADTERDGVLSWPQVNAAGGDIHRHPNSGTLSFVGSP